MLPIFDDVLARRFAAFLNGLLEVDRHAVTELIEHRVKCNHRMKTHPTVQVVVDQDIPRVGMLGILNGMLGIDESGTGPLVARFDDDGKLVEFFVRERTGETKE